MGFERLQALQIGVLNRLNLIKQFQGVNRSGKVKTALVKRKSWAEPPFSQSDLICVYKVVWNGRMTNISFKYFYHLIVTLVVGVSIANIKDANEIMRQIDYENIVGETFDESGDKGKGDAIAVCRVRQIICLIFIGLSVTFVLKPSRSIRKIYIHKNPKDASYSGSVVFECNRFFGTTPTYYVYDGNENRRIFKAFDELERKGHWNSNNVADDKRKLYQKENLGQLRLTCQFRNHELYLDLPKELSILDEGPAYKTQFDFDIKYGVMPRRGDLNPAMMNYLKQESPLGLEVLKSIRKAGDQLGLKMTEAEIGTENYVGSQRLKKSKGDTISTPGGGIAILSSVSPLKIFDQWQFFLALELSVIAFAVYIVFVDNFIEKNLVKLVSPKIRESGLYQQQQSIINDDEED